MKFTFLPIDIEHRVVEGKVKILLIGRNEKEKVILKDTFNPYFYAEIKNEKILEKVKELKYDDTKVVGVEKATKKVLGEEKELYKISCSPSIAKIKRAVEKSSECYEFDIKITRQYLLDNNIIPLQEVEVEGEKDGEYINIISYKETKEKIKKIKALAVDIETHYVPHEGMNYKRPIVMVALHDTKFKKIITWKKNSFKDAEVVKDEKEMLQKVNEYIKENNPDVLVGYYSDGFDFPYIKERCKKLKIKFTGIEDQELKVTENESRLFGYPHIDILKFIRGPMQVSLETNKYSLNEVAYELLGEKKDEIDLHNIAEDWDNEKNLDLYAKYNLQDTKLTVKLFEKTYPHMKAMVSLTNIPPVDLCRMGFSQLVEGFIIREARSYNEIVLPKPSNDQVVARRYEKAKGAFVFEPTPGLYKNVVVFDFRSLYPTIITSHNISLSTLKRKCKEKIYNPDDKKIWFCQDKRGFLSVILENIIKKRFELKKKSKTSSDPILEASVYSLKILANSFYGYIGFFGSRWYSMDCVETITAFGRHYIKDVIKKANKEGFHVIYSDTDSIFITLGEKTEDSAKKFVVSINKELPGLMELEYENTYESAIFVPQKGKESGAKKRYALAKNGRIKIIGFESVRRNVSIIAKETQEKVLEYILQKHDNEKAFSYVQEIITKLRDKKISNEKMIIKTKLSRNIDEYDAIGPHVKVAKDMKKKGLPVGYGTIVQYIITDKKGIIRERAANAEDVKEGDYDAEYYITHQIIPAVGKIFEIIGYDEEDLLKKGKQKNLKSFFK